MATTSAIKIRTTLPNGNKVTNTYSAGNKMKIVLSDAEASKFAKAVDSLQQGTATNVYTITTKEVDYE